MPGQRRPGNDQRARIQRAVVLLIATSWLLALVIAAGGSSVFAAGGSALSAAGSNPLIALSPTIIPTIVTGSPSASVTDTATAIASASATATATTQASATATSPAAATDTPPPDQGIFNPNTGPQPTKVVFAQPTVGAGASGAGGVLDPAAFGSNGLLLTASLSCMVAILGLVIAVVALYALLHGGYGPFLRALLLGKRAGKGKGNSKVLGNNVAVAGQGWDQSGAYEFDGSAEYPARGPAGRGQPGMTSRGRGFNGAPQRSRPDLRGGRDSGERR
jgi:hypothetical protein